MVAYEPIIDLATEDHRRKGYTPDAATTFRKVKEQFGKNSTTVAAEALRLRFGPGELTLADYILYRLYDERYTWEDKTCFLSDSLHWQIVGCCCPRHWRAATEDKWLAYSVLERHGFRVPRTLAVVHAGRRLFGRLPVLASPGELATFLSGVPLPVFIKPNEEFGSVGALIVTAVAGGDLEINGDHSLSVARLFALMGGRTHLLQEVVQNHRDIAALAPAVATVRMVNLVWPDRIDTPWMLLKVPAAGNIADNYWRAGNIIADLDHGTGRIRRAVRGRGPETEELDTHPESGRPLRGMAVPYWPAVRELNAAVAGMFAPVRYHNLDIAITADGPLVVEVNVGGSFVLPQMATGRGMLTPQFKAFLRSCGWSASPFWRIERAIERPIRPYIKRAIRSHY